jgi:hypothetical protein
MERVGEHMVPAGPLAVRWLAYDVPELRAGAEACVGLRLQNAGLAPWRPGISVSYHWLDDHGNAIVWDGWRTPLSTAVSPGEPLEVRVRVRTMMPPGSYRLAFDLIDESRFWFGEVGSFVLEIPVVIERRVDRRLAVRVLGSDDEATRRALGAQDEPLVEEHEAEAVAFLASGAVPAPDWSSRLLDAHAEGFAAVGGAVDSPDPHLRVWAPTPGRNPSFSAPLLMPSLVRPLRPSEHLGLPAWSPDSRLVAYDEVPWIFDGRIRLRLPRGRRRG